MDNSNDTVLTMKSCSLSRIYLPFQSIRKPSFCYVIKTTPSDAELREEQDGSKQKFVGGMMAKLWPDLCQGVMINTEEK